VPQCYFLFNGKVLERCSLHIRFGLLTEHVPLSLDDKTSYNTRFPERLSTTSYCFNIANNLQKMAFFTRPR